MYKNINLKSQIDSLLQDIVALSKQAGEQVLEIYAQQDTQIIIKKSDQSPLTIADLMSHQIISTKLQQLTPDVPILSEESANIAFTERQCWTQYWLIDPLDGTKEFIAKNDEFTINIALIEKHQPVLGVVYAPALQTCYFATFEQGAFKQVKNEAPQLLHTKPYQSGKIKVTASRRHGSEALENFLQKLPEYLIIQRGSALKCCLVAEGQADIYPRLAPTSEWDIAAAQCIVEAAGGAVIDRQGNQLRYNTKAALENPSFLVVGDKQYNWLTYL